jgi:hypothetical protein
MNANQIAAVGFLILALVAGGGMLLVRPSQGEPARLNSVFPGARLLQYFWVRVLFAIFIIVVGCFGAATAVGWV